MRLPISPASRQRFDLPAETLAVADDGRLSLRIDSPTDARRVAHHLRDERRPPSAGRINALAVLCDILQVTLERLTRTDPDLLRRILDQLEERLGRPRLDDLLAAFTDEFALDKASSTTPIAAEGATRVELLGELLRWRVARLNAPPGALRDLVGGQRLIATPGYEELMEALVASFDGITDDRVVGRSLLPMLRSPVLAGAAERDTALEAAAEGLEGQLGDRARVAEEILREEEMPRFAPGPGPLELPRFEDEGEERYAADRPWMPEVVLVAKNVRVWLTQLSRSYGRHIGRLDEIPDTELERLAGWGLSGLWLIGLWERSPASQRIKRRCGNPEAGASAYAIRAYRVAESLGGGAALDTLRQRAGACGIRIAADLVANHLALDSDWMVEHPERFLSLPRSPFPGYSFAEPDLSPSARCSIFLEEHYYDRSDAAVVFQRIDRQSGESRFVYHGNDGTSVPWNDTAQLDYLSAETREAVIRSLLEVAKQVSILRFDAAMTLTRRHYQRLWYPAPGDAGAIPSRAEFGMDAEQFAAAMPSEFWREVVERVEREAPDTLLLAEAFWLTESFFVRHLGMHRVYNSAFMHTLRDGENGKFRQLVQDMLRHDPRLLERQVNFLSNPDERTAIDQFGNGDRYFGACVVLATLPGTPLFGHGQIEGLSERYGMEYERDYHGETADAEVVARHQREIVPLLRRRRLFAGSEGFRLFGLCASPGRGDGDVDEDLLAYSNRAGDEHTLVLFNNRPAPCHGYLVRSAAFAPPATHGEATPQSSESLVEALGLTPREGEFVAWRELISGREFLRRLSDLSAAGLEIELPPFGYAVLARFRQLDDDPSGALSRLAECLGGNGVDDLVAARLQLVQEPLHDLFRQLVAAGSAGGTLSRGLSAEVRHELVDLASEFLDGLAASAPGNISPAGGRARFSATLESLERLASPPDSILWAWSLLLMLAASGRQGEPPPTALWNPLPALREMLDGALGTRRSRRHLAVLDIAVRDAWHRPSPVVAGHTPGPLGRWLSESEIADLVDLRPGGAAEELNLTALIDLVELRRLLAAIGVLSGHPGAHRVESIWRRRGRALRRLEE